MNFDESMIHGSVEPGFEKVKSAFIDNFKRGEEVGAAVAIYHKGKKVVDLWGGYRDKKSKDPWKEDTLVLVFSTTKGMSAMAIALAHSKGYFEYDEKVSKYWPEFAQNGKEDVTIRQLLSHQAGLCAIDEPMDLKVLGNTEQLSKILAAQTPLWKPGKKHGYHALTLGWYESELIRKTDPQHRTMGKFFRDEIAKPLGLEFYIGLPDDVPSSRIANMHAPMYTLRMIFNTDKMPKPFVKAFMKKGTATKRAFSNPKVLGVVKNYNTKEMRKIELPAANGIGQVRDIAKLYGIFSMGASELGIKPETMKSITEPAKPPEDGRFDEVLQSESMFSLGFLKPFPECQFGTSSKAFGTPGAGGSFGFADPDTQTGFAYAMNKSGFYLLVDKRQDDLAKAYYECLK
ncbi:MAG: beta-lactamase family protein [Candidatus Lokiarchaeota archaeon]|nr:beta-lactamase family protein [Candidatus Lokiarchaeota archaeon]